MGGRGGYKGHEEAVMYVVIVFSVVREIEIRSGKSQGNLVIKKTHEPCLDTLQYQDMLNLKRGWL